MLLQRKDVRRVFKIFLALFIYGMIANFSFANPDLSIFEDENFCEQMEAMGHGRLVALAKNPLPEPSLKVMRARQELLELNAQSSYFPQLLGTFPGGLEGALVPYKEDIKSCLNMFFLLTKGLFEREHTEALRLPTWDLYQHCYLDPKSSVAKQQGSNIIRLYWMALSFHIGQLSALPGRSFLEELLTIRFTPPSRKSTRKKEHKLWAFLAPLIQGDIAFSQNQPLESVKAIYSQCVVPEVWNEASLPDYMSLRRALVECAGNYGRCYNPETHGIIDEVTFRKELEKALISRDNQLSLMAKLLQIQYNLGHLYDGLEEKRMTKHEASEQKKQKREALEDLKRLVATPVVSHLARFVEIAEYLRQEKTTVAERLIKQAQKEEDPAFSYIYWGTALEIVLGIHDDRAPDFKAVRGYLAQYEDVRRCPKYAIALVHGIYKGSFGEEGTDVEKARRLLEAFPDNPYVLGVRANELIRSRHYKEAEEFLIREGNRRSHYSLARLYMSKKSGLWAPEKGTDLLMGLGHYNYRDSRARLLKSAYESSGRKVNPSKSVIKAFCALSDWSPESIQAFLMQRVPVASIVVNFKPSENTDGASAAALPDSTALKDEDFLQDPDSEETVEFMKAYAAVDPEEELTVLDYQTEALMDKVRENYIWTWREFLRLLNVLGAKHSPGTISFPMVDGVFNYHLFHNGSVRFSLRDGYYKHLYRMINQRYLYLLDHQK